MVVLWPKMKAPTTMVMTAQTIRMDLKREIPEMGVLKMVHNVT